ncbi:polyphosphate polymerase domain-containing protein [Butyrivibrio sp. XB500-5]|uniref:polyphosphate polymerase domain-containing protein n=1 Tax=Butyrivibrio sp. XB500-5 TaxID=2364880 RepID=UPI000EA8F50D|nr:polyphosphate polymerase domain-containing protein [Butyrivibrio sp. XB500-5]RKM62933.1 polyphosphate polymerase domain-containing protein [Butyrivibrio sp. XB500-5]
MRQFRNEWKYLINYGEYESLKCQMKPYFHLDPNAKGDGYLIRSLYFDDLWNSAYEEKEVGVYFRKKYRIRIYNFSDTSIKLERKLKQGSYIYKESASLTRDEVYKILDGDYEFLLHSDNNLCREFYFECISNMMRPRVIVDYDRTPFIMDAGTVRITFDKKVRAAVGGFDIFDDSLPTLSALPSDKLIMEIKYTEFLPKIVKELAPPSRSEFVAASKYVLCCDKTKYLFDNNYYADERSLI